MISKGKVKKLLDKTSFSCIIDRVDQVERFNPMTECKECHKEFFQNRPFQVFCSDKCKGVFHRRRYRADKIADGEGQRYRVEYLGDGSRVLRKTNGHRDRATPEQKAEAKLTLEKIIASMETQVVETKIKLRRRI